MSGVLDRPLRKVAKTLLRKFGAPITVTLINKASEYNTAQGREGQTPTVVSTHALDVPSKGQYQKEPGAIARQTKWLVPAIDFTTRAPRSNDTVTRAGKEYRILHVLPYETGELAGLYELRIAR